jgi:hypothetical protein
MNSVLIVRSTKNPDTVMGSITWVDGTPKPAGLGIGQLFRSLKKRTLIDDDEKLFTMLAEQGWTNGYLEIVSASPKE